MSLQVKLLLVFFIILLSSCANYKTRQPVEEIEKKYFSSKGFALIYKDDFYNDGVINKKLNNNEFEVMHSFLKKNTQIKIINPENLKFVEIKVLKKANYPSIFSIIVSEKIAKSLELNINDPYVEILELKSNKKFIAKKSNIFDEEKNVLEKAPVNEVKIDDLSSSKLVLKKKDKKSNFFIIVGDFYYSDSAYNLKKELTTKTQIKNFFVKKINDTKYRLLLGPYKNFNALKSGYISLNKLNFENLNIYKD